MVENWKECREYSLLEEHTIKGAQPLVFQIVIKFNPVWEFWSGKIICTSEKYETENNTTSL